MKPFCGAEPLVGEIVGLRTFRVDESGMLLALYGNLAWYDGTNTAVCAPPTGERERRDHDVPSVECECGFYAYGTTEAAASSRNSRYVQAVVSCWGRVVAGTQGVRAEHARIDALWLHPNVPDAVRRRVASRYPSARQFDRPDEMLAAFPLSTLACYEPIRRRPMAAQLATVVLGAGMLTAGVLAWLLAPMFGLAGWLLRAPVLRAIVVAAGGYLLTLRPGYFPVAGSPREKAFCGVRP